MSVYTVIEPNQLNDFLSLYDAGQLVDFKGISDGIENTNYFVNTTKSRYVLTIFEHHSYIEMQYYLGLMHHLNKNDVPSANPVADKKGDYVNIFKNKPIALVERLQGASITHVTLNHCQQLGVAMGKMHRAGLSYKQRQTNPRGPLWCQKTARKLLAKLSTTQQLLLSNEINYQKQMRTIKLPCGVVHGDLFRDNALWHGDTFSGIIDFYYSCDDVLLYDLAVVANDWCLNTDASLNKEKVTELLKSYHQYRPLEKTEKQYWSLMLRAAALRFWLSRLYDKYFPREGELVHTKNPDAFKEILKDRVAKKDSYTNYWL